MIIFQACYLMLYYQAHYLTILVVIPNCQVQHFCQHKILHIKMLSSQNIMCYISYDMLLRLWEDLTNEQKSIHWEHLVWHTQKCMEESEHISIILLIHFKNMQVASEAIVPLMNLMLMELALLMRTHDDTYGHLLQIWTSSSFCPCGTSRNITIPDFVGDDYFCDSGIQRNENYTAAFSNPLWDGEGCSPDYGCCNHKCPPWFYKELDECTSEFIEFRVCRDQRRPNEDLLIEAIDIYIHS